MFRYRLLSALVLIPLIIGLTLLGGGWFLGLVMAVLTLASYEYAQIVRHGGGQTSFVLVSGLCWLAALVAYYRAFFLALPLTALFAFATLTWATIRYERGAHAALLDWTLTVAGGVYLGWIGAHFVLMRGITAQTGGQVIDAGLNWTVLALASTWLADTGAYATGRWLGKHKMSPRLSPAKTWEGYAGGVAWGTAFGAIWPWLSAAARLPQPPDLTVWHSLTLALLIAILTPLGDLGESLLKRWAGVKDSGTLIPGHGGMFDRLDTLLWAAVIAYYYVTWMPVFK